MRGFLLILAAALRYPATLLGAWLWERASRRYLPVKPQKRFYAIRFVLFWTGLVGPMWIGDENLIFFLLTFIGGFLLCYQASREARMVVGVVFYLLMAGLGMMIDTAYDIIPANIIIPMNIEALADISGPLLKVLAAALVYALSRKLNPQDKRIALPGRLWWLCALLSMAPLIMILSFSLWNGFGQGRMDAGQYRIAYTVLPFVFLSALALLVAIVTLSRHEELERAARLAQMRELYYSGLQSKETQVRTLRHDLRNHLGAVQGLLTQGETERAAKYLEELTASPALHGVKRICENELANVVLTGKLEEMERKGLQPDILATLPQNMPVADTDLCALLGNALDNAIEAGAKAKDKSILIRIRADRGMLMLRVENGCADVPVAINGTFTSSKSDAGQHGFGILGMREIATRYGGTLETAVHGSRFELVACLPLPAGNIEQAYPR